jgi:hypothetical protein
MSQKHFLPKIAQVEDDREFDIRNDRISELESLNSLLEEQVNLLKDRLEQAENVKSNSID